MSPTDRSKLGTAGEGHARRLLEANGYRFLDANWHCPDGELDLVLIDDAELVFVEVKTRRGEGFGSAEESVTPAKGRKLMAAAGWYLQAHPELGDPIWRVDLVAITLGGDGRVVRVSHIENAVNAG